jgi:hypothetical protein
MEMPVIICSDIFHDSKVCLVRELSPAEIKEINESACGTGCAQERSDKFLLFPLFDFHLPLSRLDIAQARLGFVLCSHCSIGSAGQ